MPELPEVEAVARSLNEFVSGRSIVAADLLRERLVPSMPAEEFSADLRNARINFVHRRGKHLLFDLDNGHTLIAHLRMTGRFILLSEHQEDPKFTHAVFHLDDGTRLVFQDQRHFGMMNVTRTECLHESPELKYLGPEPLSDAFTARYVHSVTGRSSRSIKTILLDQTKFCGLGNIYASEALHLARVNPITPAQRISWRKSVSLLLAIRTVLENAIAHSASRPNDPEDLESGFYNGSSGSRWLVYDREGQPCLSCKSPIKRIKQDGRSSYFCSRCQRKS